MQGSCTTQCSCLEGIAVSIYFVLRIIVLLDPVIAAILIILVAPLCEIPDVHLRGVLWFAN